MAIEAYIFNPEAREVVYSRGLEADDYIELSGVRDDQGREISLYCDSRGEGAIFGICGDKNLVDMDEDEPDGDHSMALDPVACVDEGEEVRLSVFADNQTERQLLLVRGLGNLSLDQSDGFYHQWLIDQRYVPKEPEDIGGLESIPEDQLEVTFFSRN